jgi:putative two-component system response regulator
MESLMRVDGSSHQRVLIVDDEPQAQHLLCRLLERAGYDCDGAGNASEARALFRDHAYHLLLSDVNMPGESGLQLVQHVLGEYPDTAAVMVTGLDDPDLAKVALEQGAYGYVIKPFTPNEILISVVNALRRRELEIENRAYREALEGIVTARTAALEQSAKQLKLTREETVRRLSRAIEYRDQETGGHTDRMSRYAALLATHLGLDSESIRLASPMHDVGKVALSDSILLKPGKLTPAERQAMERHAEIGHEILAGSGSALLELAATIALTHHEKFDGTGYPNGLSGEEIPIEGQIAAIADVFDALTSDRPYRPAFSIDEAVQMMCEQRGTHFNPHLLDVFIETIHDQVVAGNHLDAHEERDDPTPAGATSRAEAQC